MRTGVGGGADAGGGGGGGGASSAVACVWTAGCAAAARRFAALRGLGSAAEFAVCTGVFASMEAIMWVGGVACFGL